MSDSDEVVAWFYPTSPFTSTKEYDGNNDRVPLVPQSLLLREREAREKAEADALREGHLRESVADDLVRVLSRAEASEARAEAAEAALRSAPPKSLVDAARALDNFAWSAITHIDAPEALQYLQELLNNLRAALAQSKDTR